MQVGTPRSPSLERGLVVIHLHLEIAVEIPVHADTGVARCARRHIGISEPRRRAALECGIIDALYAKSRDHFHGAESGAATRIGISRCGVAKRGVFAGHNPVAVHLPRLTVEIAFLIASAGYQLMRIDVLA